MFDIVSRLHGVGLGLRHEFLPELKNCSESPVDFLEIAPENWLNVGGKRSRQLAYFSERYPLLAHGLSLSIGGPEPLNLEFINQLKAFFKRYNVMFYSEHLSYCSDEQGYLYDLMPIPFTEEAVVYVSNRIKKVQDCLGRRLVLENVSYYYSPSPAMSELEFICAVLNEADCELLLDINNIYVNSVNHSYCPYDFLDGLPHERVRYVHIAGHHQENRDCLIDTHGAPVTHDVWKLLEYCYQHHAIYPTLLERDNDIPPLEELLLEMSQIRQSQSSQERCCHV